MPRSPLNWKHYLKDYFVFSKTQRNAAIVLLVLIACGCIVPLILSHLESSKKENAPQVVIKAIDDFEEDTSLRYRKKPEPGNFTPSAEPVKMYEKSAAETFVFDPNTASFEDWKRLGIREKTIETIFKYKAKGGKFYKPADIEKIYGIRKEDAERLIPYVKIQNRETIGTGGNKSVPSDKNSTGKPLVVDVNTGDTTEWKKLRGIGSKLAARIVKYREALGGFYNVNQVAETFGLPDSTFQNMKPHLTIGAINIQKRNINTAELNQLKMPYIPYNVANAIIQYRTKNGNFSSVNDLKKIPLIDDDLFVKISPYLSVE
jgi:competence ComEA-like helix-hairpin-helix protein